MIREAYSSEGRTGSSGAAGTLLGVRLLRIVANGQSLVYRNFQRRQVGDDAVIVAVLAISFGG
jgi:hypothetical protein